MAFEEFRGGSPDKCIQRDDSNAASVMTGPQYEKKQVRFAEAQSIRISLNSSAS